MADLTVVGFQGTHRAAEVLDQLQRLNSEALLELDDAVAVYRTRSGKLRVDQSMYFTTKEETGWGGVVGALVGSLLALPVAALAAAPAAAAALGIGGAAIGATGGAVVAFDEATTWREAYGISDDFVKQVGGMVQSGQSAIFALVRTARAGTIAERFRGYGGTVLRTTIPEDQAKKLGETLAAQSASAVR